MSPAPLRRRRKGRDPRRKRRRGDEIWWRRVVEGAKPPSSVLSNADVDMRDLGVDDHHHSPAAVEPFYMLTPGEGRHADEGGRCIDRRRGRHAGPLLSGASKSGLPCSRRGPTATGSCVRSRRQACPGSTMQGGRVVGDRRGGERAPDPPPEFPSTRAQAWMAVEASSQLAGRVERGTGEH
ncbi:hypothetical protein E2562_031777 [Oryza meyeriana var. granulata]|uniref:Uncharacterized protein n=1 Tax=Oryza meyeriana var. granulata TaxID=110450 RepID=A0A6G1CJW8_9ORYZ|nr:hypothetical protein E2562_031777 [Oryza meyeriana var. granulata]